MKSGVIVCRISPSLPFQMEQKGWVGKGQLSTEIITLLLVSWVVPPIPVHLSLRGVLFNPVLYKAMYATDYCIIGVLSPCGDCKTSVMTIKDS